MLNERFEVPRQQLVDAVDRMLGDAREHVAEKRLGVVSVELRRAEQAIDRRGLFASGVAAGEEKVLAPKCNTS